MRVLKGLERLGRRKLSTFFRIISIRSAQATQGDPCRILVLRIDSRIGNLVLLTSFLRALQDRFPTARISVLASHRFAGILEGQPWQLIKVDKKALIRNPFMFFTLVKHLRNSGFDTVVDASHPHSFSLSTAVLSGLTGIARRVGSPSPGSEGWYTHMPSSDVWPGREVHESRALHALGYVWSNWPDWEPPRLTVSKVEREDLVGIHTGGKRGRAFSVQRLKSIADAVGDPGRVILFWGNDEERGRAEAAAGNRYGVSPGIELKELPEALAALRLFVTPDTGLMHVASAVNTPVIAVFTVNNCARFRPLSDGSEELLEPSDDDIARAIRLSLQAWRKPIDQCRKDEFSGS